MTESNQSLPHVLIVDDEGELAEVLALRLERAGFRVSLAEDGPKGLASAQNDPPQLILLDVMMPGPNGFEICRALRADQRTAGCRIVMLTATRDLKQAKDAGADQIMLKPFEADHLIRQIKTLIDRGAVK